MGTKRLSDQAFVWKDSIITLTHVYTQLYNQSRNLRNDFLFILLVMNKLSWNNIFFLHLNI